MKKNLLVFSLLLIFLLVPIGSYATTSEMEPNNTISQANFMYANTWKEGTISSSSDVDYFKFTATQATGFVRLDKPTRHKITIRLVDSNDVSVADWSSGDENSVSIVLRYNGYVGKEYYIKVIPGMGYNPQYSGTLYTISN